MNGNEYPPDTAVALQRAVEAAHETLRLAAATFAEISSVITVLMARSDPEAWTLAERAGPLVESCVQLRHMLVTVDALAMRIALQLQLGPKPPKCDGNKPN